MQTAIHEAFSNPMPRYQAVMSLLDQTTIEQLAKFAAGKFVMVLEETRDGLECWWCPADAEDHTGEVIHTSEKVFEGQKLPGEIQTFLDALALDLTLQDVLEHCDQIEISRPGAANLALRLILEKEADRLKCEVTRPYVDGQNTSILA